MPVWRDNFIDFQLRLLSSSKYEEQEFTLRPTADHIMYSGTERRYKVAGDFVVGEKMISTRGEWMIVDIHSMQGESRRVINPVTWSGTILWLQLDQSEAPDLKFNLKDTNLAPPVAVHAASFIQATDGVIQEGSEVYILQLYTMVSIYNCFLSMHFPQLTQELDFDFMWLKLLIVNKFTPFIRDNVLSYLTVMPFIPPFVLDWISLLIFTFVSMPIMYITDFTCTLYATLRYLILPVTFMNNHFVLFLLTSCSVLLALRLPTVLRLSISNKEKSTRLRY